MGGGGGGGPRASGPWSHLKLSKGALITKYPLKCGTTAFIRLYFSLKASMSLFFTLRVLGRCIGAVIRYLCQFSSAITQVTPISSHCYPSLLPQLCDGSHP